MNAGTMKVRMSIPIISPEFSFRLFGSQRDETCPALDAFLDLGNTSGSKSGSAQEAAFEIDVTAGQARVPPECMRSTRIWRLPVRRQANRAPKRGPGPIASPAYCERVENPKCQQGGGIGVEQGGRGKLYAKDRDDEFLQFVGSPADRRPGCHQPLKARR